MRAGVKLANSRGVTCVHDKDGGLGAAGLWQRLDESAGLTLRVWQSVPHEKLPELRSLGVRSGIGRRCSDRLPEGLHGRHARLRDGAHAGRQRSADHERGGARGHCPPGAEVGWPVAVHAIGDRANRNALDAFERTPDAWQPRGLRHRIEHAQCVAPEDVPGSERSASPPRCSSRTRRRTASSPSGSGPAASRARMPGARCSTRARARERLGRADRGARPPRRRPRGGLSNNRRASRLAARAGRDARGGARRDLCRAGVALGDERRRGKLLPGCLADLVVLDRDPLACQPGELREVHVVATMVSGRWAYNPPPWD